MKSYPELKMPKSKSVTTVCYGKTEHWADREEAKDYFLEAMMGTDGSERDRYAGIYIQLINGLDLCTDEED